MGLKVQVQKRKKTEKNNAKIWEKGKKSERSDKVHLPLDPQILQI